MHIFFFLQHFPALPSVILFIQNLNFISFKCRSFLNAAFLFYCVYLQIKKNTSINMELNRSFHMILKCNSYFCFYRLLTNQFRLLNQPLRVDTPKKVYLPFEFPVCQVFAFVLIHLLNISHVQQIWPISALSETRKKSELKLIKYIFFSSQQERFHNQKYIQLLLIFFFSDRHK